MFNKPSIPQHPPVEHFVPGYPFYDRIGTGLAEKLVELIEFIAATLVPFRR